MIHFLRFIEADIVDCHCQPSHARTNCQEHQNHIDYCSKQPSKCSMASMILQTLTLLQRSQWFREIRLHAPSLGENVMQFKSALEDNTATRLKSNDIVLTTYWELCQSYPNPGKKLVAEWEEQKLDLFAEYQRWANDHQHENGLLHQIEWYRVRKLVPTSLLIS